MTGQFESALHQAAEVLFKQIAEYPQIAPKVGPVAMFLEHIAGDVDVHVASRLKEANRIKGILNKAAEIAPGAATAAWKDVIGLAPTSPDDYASKALDAYLGRLKAALIEVHAWIETADVPARQELLDEIWEYLSDQAKHESRVVPPMW